jgi:hypothetical protein
LPRFGEPFDRAENQPLGNAYDAAPNCPASLVQPGTAPKAPTAVTPAPASAPAFLMRFLPQNPHLALGAAEAPVVSTAVTSSITAASAVEPRAEISLVI